MDKFHYLFRSNTFFLPSLNNLRKYLYLVFANIGITIVILSWKRLRFSVYVRTISWLIAIIYFILIEFLLIIVFRHFICGFGGYEQVLLIYGNILFHLSTVSSLNIFIGLLVGLVSFAMLWPQSRCQSETLFVSR